MLLLYQNCKECVPEQVLQEHRNSQFEGMFKYARLVDDLVGQGENHIPSAQTACCPHVY